MFTVGRTRQILGLARLLKSGLLSDVQLVLGDRTWNLHQVTLVSRCAWFKTALTRLSVTSRRLKRARSYSRSRVGNLHNQNQCNQRRVHRQTASWRGLFTVGRLQALPDPTISSFAPLEAIHTPIPPFFCASSYWTGLLLLRPTKEESAQVRSTYLSPSKRLLTGLYRLSESASGFHRCINDP